MPIDPTVITPQSVALYYARRFSAAATDYFRRLDLAGLRVTAYDAVNARLIDRLVANGGNFWPDSGAFNAMAGYLFPTAGTLIPLHPSHDAGTLINFVSGDWNAVTGLKGDGSTKHIDSNRTTNNQNDNSCGVWVSNFPADFGGPVGNMIAKGSNSVAGSTLIGIRASDARINTSNSETSVVSSSPVSITKGYYGNSRSSGTSYVRRFNNNSETLARDSEAPNEVSFLIFSSPSSNFFIGNLALYHIGPNLNGAGELAEFDAAITEWATGLAAA